MYRLEDRRPLIALFALCTGAVFLWAVGVLMVRQFRHAYLPWNLFLAMVPLAFALGIEALARRGRNLGAVALGVPWLLFLPNSPYILTDFIHLQRSYSDWAWVHLLMLVWFSFAGLAAGIYSVHLVHRRVAEHLGVVAGWLFVGSTSLLAGLGIALGRFQRWNSWDILHRPGDILVDVVYHVPLGRLSHESIVSTGLGVFFALVYVLFWSLRVERIPVEVERTGARGPG